MAANRVEMEGWIVSRDAEQEGNRPGRFRMSTYCSGTKAKDNVRTAFVTVSQFGMDVASLKKGTKVKVIGRLSPWENKDGQQVLDVQCDDYDDTDHSITVLDADDAAPARKPARQAEPSYEDEPF